MLVYLGSVLRHWVASMSGVVSLAIGAAIQWRWIAPATVSTPRMWWTISGVAFGIAMFQAWFDEHRKRVQLEEAGPKLVVDHLPDESPPKWRITNSGEADALNILSDEIRSYTTSAEIERIQRLAKGESSHLMFRVRKDGTYYGRYHHPIVLIDAVKKGAEGKTGSTEEYMEVLANHSIPMRLTFSDPHGLRFESSSEIRWNHMRHQGYAHHVRTGPVIELAWWQRLWRWIVNKLPARFHPEARP